MHPRARTLILLGPLASLLALAACGPDRTPAPEGDATEGPPAGGTASHDAGTPPADEGSTTSRGEDTTGMGSASDDAATSGEDTRGADCEPGPPVDARGFVPEQISIDQNQSTADALGDINGDGFGDFVMRGMVVFGRDDHEPIATADIMAGVGGIAFQVGRRVANAGDVNMDGVTDLLVGDPNADFAGPNWGRAYLLFGKIDPTPWDVTAITQGQAGIAIDGVAGFMGGSGDGVGDLDGDGFGDFVVSAAGLGDGRSLGLGRVYGIFGSQMTGVYGDAVVGRSLRGWRIDGAAPQTYLGGTVKRLGDLNGDGVPDYALSTGGPQPRILVVFGGDAPPDLDDIAAGIGGYTIGSDLVFSGPFDTGDVNGDGLMDVVLAMNDGLRVAYGKGDTAPVTTADLDAGIGGFAVVSALGEVFEGGVGEFVGDFDGDGYGDIVRGHGVDHGDAGTSYFVLGGCGPSTTSLEDIAQGVGGFVVEGEPGQQLGSHAGGIGDINGDGFDDALLSGTAGQHSRIVLGAPLR